MTTERTPGLRSSDQLPQEPRQTNLSSEVPDVTLGKPRDLATLSEIDPSRLDPNFRYRMVHKSPLKVARARAKGYVVVDPATEVIVNAVGESPESEDGRYTFADTILMKIDLRQFRARRHAQKRKTDAKLGAPTKKFKRDARTASEKLGRRIRVVTQDNQKGEPGE